MTGERWKETKELFAEARELLEVEREALLRRHAETDPELVAEVRRLLASAAFSTDFLEPPDKERIEKPLQMLSFDFRGLRLGEFDLEEEIGRGASGVVYLGVQRSLARKVAIKILAPQLASTPQARQRFEREALAASRLRHSAIVAVLAFGEQHGALYLVMEHVPGKTLHQHLESARLARGRDAGKAKHQLDVNSPEAAARIALRLAEALEYCHGQGIVHRDIKPQNILIALDGSPRIVDFGVAKDRSLEGITTDGLVSGTLQYMSPEQAEARTGELDARTDIYSLGVVLYEMLTLRPPFDGVSSPDIVRRVLTERAVPAHHVDAGVPRSLSVICARALRKDPRTRYESAEEMAQDLRAFLAGRSIAIGARIKLEDAYRAVFVTRPWLAITGILLLFAAIAIYPTEGGVRPPDKAAVLESQQTEDAADPTSSSHERAAAYRALRKAAEARLPNTPPKKRTE